MKIAFLVKGLDTPRTRYRVLQYLPLLEKQRASVKVIDIPRRPLERWSAFLSLRDFDAVVIQKILFSCLDFRLLRREAKRLIFDVDDAVMVKADTTHHASRRRRSRFLRTVKGTDLVFVGNSYLEGTVRNLGARTLLVPTCVDLDRYPERSERPVHPGDRLHLGWIGSSSTLPHLAELKPIFQRLSIVSTPMDLSIICDTFLEEIGLPVQRKAWSESTEVSDLMDLDIGLAPLPENPWTVGKSATKVVQYMAAGLPVICSPVGANAEIVRDGVTGFHAKNSDEWFEKILYLAEHPEVRTQMGKEGRRLVEKAYSVQAVFHAVYEGLKGCSVAPESEGLT